MYRVEIEMASILFQNISFMVSYTIVLVKENPGEKMRETAAGSTFTTGRKKKLITNVWRLKER